MQKLLVLTAKKHDFINSNGKIAFPEATNYTL